MRSFKNKSKREQELKKEAEKEEDPFEEIEETLQNQDFGSIQEDEEQ